MTAIAHMETAVEGLYATTPEPLPFAPSLDIRAFVLQRERGNVLVYSTTVLESDAPAIEDLGGISRHYLNHRHEAMFSSDWAASPVRARERARVGGRRVPRAGDLLEAPHAG